jgi:hypothetical protein
MIQNFRSLIALGALAVMTSRVGAAEIDVHAGLGAEWIQIPRGESLEPLDLFALVVNTRVTIAGDTELALRLEGLDASGTEEYASSRGDMTLSFAHTFRREKSRFLDYIGVEGGYVDPASDRELSTGIEFYGTVRAAGGYTRLGYETSLTLASLRSDPGEADSLFTYSIGARSQWGRVTWGLDYLTLKDRGSDEPSSLGHWGQVIVSARWDPRLQAFAFLRKGFTGDNDGWYAGINCQIRLGH